jgi:hypothetical protein
MEHSSDKECHAFVCMLVCKRKVFWNILMSCQVSFCVHLGQLSDDRCVT